MPERIRRFDFLMNYNRGDLMMLAAGVVWALYSIIGKKLPVPPITATTCSVFLACCCGRSHSFIRFQLIT
ncbi:hypothetical protein ABEO46_10535 [Geobacillus stearothermophilus]|uniref:Uncharacterized protein n=1 Tax=Geobacillus stearothermophilus TaxID=1422 RepID=A0A150MD27_GEOSE|nr:hypothetical protein B4109_1260 [Geobacillus stearothermophilus]